MHILSHLSAAERPIQCELCSKRFIDKSQFRRHLPYHSDVRAFPCEFPLCGMKYKTKNDLRKHVKRVHQKLKTENQTCDS